MKSAAEMIEYYKSGVLPSHWMTEISNQYISMARGGDGGLLGIGGYPTCREYNYPGHPDSFFQKVCDAMGWDWRDSQ